MKQDDMEFLRQLTDATTDACRVLPGMEAAPGTINQLPFTATRPGGRDCYPAIWVQDFTMIFYGGFLTGEEGMNHLKLFLQCQNSEKPRDLQNGASIPLHAIPDHVRFDGRPVFFPGTYSADDDQGGEPWGLSPPYNNHYDVIWLAHMLWQRLKDPHFLMEEVGRVSVYERLKNAYGVPPADPRTGIVYTTAENRAVGFIFCDSVYMTGSLLMASLLRVRASRQLADLASVLGRETDAEFYNQQARLTGEHIAATFGCNPDTGGWLRACTGVSSQPDVWGTIYAVYLGVLPSGVNQHALETIVNGLRNGMIENEGALRHVPIGFDASEQSAWERTVTHHNRYQNGAYWHMPTGWLVAILENSYPNEAQALFNSYATHMHKNAFTKGQEFGAPWECVGWNDTACQNPIFGPSLTVPYGVLAEIEVK